MLPNLQNEVKNVRSIELALGSVNLVERGFWTLLGVVGIVWACYFIPGQINLWKENPSIITKGQVDLADLQYPGISIAMPGSTKYGIIERLGNHLKADDPPEYFVEFRKLFLKCGLMSKSNTFGAYLDSDFHYVYTNDCFGAKAKYQVDIRTACNEVRTFH